jgi:hypothetical protein
MWVSQAVKLAIIDAAFDACFHEADRSAAGEAQDCPRRFGPRSGLISCRSADPVLSEGEVSKSAHSLLLSDRGQPARS